MIAIIKSYTELIGTALKMPTKRALQNYLLRVALSWRVRKRSN